MALSNVQNSISDIADFKAYVDRIVERFSTIGIEIQGYGDQSLPYFSALTESQRARSLFEIKGYCECIDVAVSEGWSLKDEKMSLWAALKYFGWRPTADIFECISECHAIELYNLEGIQVWRNYRFMEVCSYTLEEVFCYSWGQRYLRDEEAAQKAEAMVHSLFEQDIKNAKTLRPAIQNTLTEAFSEERLIIEVYHDLLSPVFGVDKKLQGFIVASKVQVVGSAKFLTDKSQSHNVRVKPHAESTI